ncbi:MAG: flagellar hook-length control protein FliK [Burkholderiaceae bacterium]
MALQPSSHPRAHGAHATTHAAHAAHAASKAKPALAAAEGEGGGFAAQLLKAQPSSVDKDLKAADAKPRAESANKPDGEQDADARDADGKSDKDGRPADPKAPLDPAALLAAQQAQQQQPIAPPTTSLADKGLADDHDEFASDPLGALRKAAGKGGKDDGRQALLANLAAGRTAAAPDTAAGQSAKGGAANRADITAALAKAEGAVKAATEARDALAAMLPQPDPVAVQAGAVGAPSNATLDANQGVQAPPPAMPAQATLPMPPHSPAFAPALGHQIDVWMKGGVQHAEVQLSPQDLGPIRVRIEMEGAHARVHMSADVQSTRDALQHAMPQLSEQLGQVGLSLTGGGVSDQPAFQQAQSQAQGGGTGGPGRQADNPHTGNQGADDMALAATPRRALQPRGLLDTYA